MRARAKLGLLVAAPFSLGLVVLGLLVASERLAERSNERILLWAVHSEAVWEVELAADRYLDALERHVDGRAAAAEVDVARDTLARAATASAALAGQFPPDEQRSEAELTVAVGEVTRRGAAVRAGLDRRAARALRRYYQDEVVPVIARRMTEEVRGVHTTVRVLRRQDRRLLAAGLGIAGALLLGGLAASWLIAAQLGRALGRLTREARELAGDHAGTRAVESRDELDVLAQAFHDMSVALERQRHERFGFLAGVAHDLRNPLTPMKLAVQGLTRAAALPAETRVREVLAVVERQIGALDRMTSDLLDAAQIEAGELQLRLAECDVGLLLREIVELYEKAEPRCTLSVHAPAGPVPLRCDATRIAQVLHNLLSNALKYSPAGCRVGVALTRAVDEVVIAVTDEGGGIAPEEREAIFLAFRRLPAARRRAGGNGLGLAIARRIALAHGGALEVDSTPGVGSTFSLRLPVAGAAAPPRRAE
ncbi:MAG TPA: HAMP domain-containing sensor histidine kinase [Polyangia bacterium]